MAKKKTTIDDLAVMVKKGFDQTTDKESVNKRFDEIDKRFDGVDKRFIGVEQRLDHMNARLGSVEVERDVAEIRKHFVYRDEFEDAPACLRLVEKKLGIHSGK